jgi:hypothetical protein
MRVAISEFMDERAVAQLDARHEVLYEPKLVDDRARLRIETAGCEAVKILFTPEIEERARTQGFRVDPRGAVRFGEFLKSEVERWGRVINTAGIRAD